MTNNYFYDLPEELQKYIEEFIKVPKLSIKQEIQYKDRINTSVSTNLNKRTLWVERTKGVWNYDTELIIHNLIKFFEEFNIVKSVDIQTIPRYKFKKHTSFKRDESKHNIINKFLPCQADHIGTYKTKNNKHIIISRPYGSGEAVEGIDAAHFKCGFKKYNRTLYYNPRLSTNTYILIL